VANPKPVPDYLVSNTIEYIYIYIYIYINEYKLKYICIYTYIYSNFTYNVRCFRVPQVKDHCSTTPTTTTTIPFYLVKESICSTRRPVYSKSNISMQFENLNESTLVLRVPANFNNDPKLRCVFPTLLHI
jgi:hypothetical protein